MNKPFSPQSHFTVFSNYVLDEIMPTLKPTHWQVLCFVIRKTLGWQKAEDTISYSQIIKGTAISSRATISAALQDLADKRYITVVAEGDGKINTIRLNTNFEVPTSSKNEPVPVQKMNQLDKEPVQKMNTQKKVIKEINQSQDDSPPTTNRKHPSADRDGKMLIELVRARGFMYLDSQTSKIAMQLETDYPDNKLRIALDRATEAHQKQIKVGKRGITAPMAYMAAVLAGMDSDDAVSVESNVVNVNLLLENAYT